MHNPLTRAFTWLAGMPPEAGGLAVRRKPYPLTLDDPFVQVSHADVLSFRDMFEHLCCLSETGGGKTSGPLRALLAQYFRLGFGGLICTYKSDDTARAVALARDTGREASLIVVRPGGKWRCSLLDWELSRPGAGAGLVENAVALLMEAMTNAAPKGYRQSQDAIWDDSVGRLLRHEMLLLRAAGLRVTIDRLKDLADGIPSASSTGGLFWPEHSAVRECLRRAKAEGADAATVRLCETFFTQECTRPGSSRFVSSVIASWLNMSDTFQSGPVKELLFAEHPTFTVDVSRRGAIVVLDMPVAEFAAAGKVLQLTYKAAFTNEVLRRQNLPLGERPCFFVCDEYQGLATALDAKLMQAGRSSWVSALVLTQNLPNLYAVMEPGRAHDVVDSMLGNFGTLILGRNKCHVTNQWAAETIQKWMTRRWNGGWTRTEGEQGGWNAGRSGNSGSGPGGPTSGGGWSSGVSGGWSSSDSDNLGWRQELDHAVPPSTFLRLSGGGPPHYLVETVLIKAGKKFRASRGKPFLGVRWPQR